MGGFGQERQRDGEQWSKKKENEKEREEMDRQRYIRERGGERWPEE